jgi:glycosyltransferase involved in cell wall biosynthesis
MRLCGRWPSPEKQLTPVNTDVSLIARPKRILLVSGFRVFPAITGAHIRTSGIARSLARLGHNVLIYSLAGRHIDYLTSKKSLHDHDDYFCSEVIEPNLVEEINLSLGVGLIQTIGRRLHFPRIWQYGLLRSGPIPQRLRRAIERADIVLSDMPWCPPVTDLRPLKPWFLISHNLEHRLLEQGNALHRCFAAWMQRVEFEAPKLYDDIFTCSEEDRDFFLHHDPTQRLKLPIVRCGVDPNEYAVSKNTRERIRAELDLSDCDRVLVFSGSGFGPNVEALEWLRKFCRAERDFLCREHLKFLIVGSVAPTAYDDGALISVGSVPEVAPYLAASDAGLNPIMRGSGANVKLFQYLASQLPVISTSFGVRGTKLQPNQDFLPYEPAMFKSVLQRFTSERSAEEWRSFAQQVWSRHRNSCDIRELVRAAISQLPAFPA